VYTAVVSTLHIERAVYVHVVPYGHMMTSGYPLKLQSCNACSICWYSLCRGLRSIKWSAIEASRRGTAGFSLGARPHHQHSQRRDCCGCFTMGTILFVRLNFQVWSLKAAGYTCFAFLIVLFFSFDEFMRVWCRVVNEVKIEVAIGWVWVPVGSG
jgi:hypothetical protein